MAFIVYFDSHRSNIMNSRRIMACFTVSRNEFNFNYLQFCSIDFKSQFDTYTHREEQQREKNMKIILLNELLRWTTNYQRFWMMPFFFLQSNLILIFQSIQWNFFLFVPQIFISYILKDKCE